MNLENMKNYVGCKIIKAGLSNLEKYKKIKYGENAVIGEDDKNIECYIVVYPPIGNNEEKPYISMSPKDVFEKAYRIVEDCEISLMIGDK
jgi:hypothetical protein